MDDFLKKYKLNKDYVFTFTLLILFLLALKFWLVRFGWISFSSNWFVILVIILIITFLTSPTFKREKRFMDLIDVVKKKIPNTINSKIIEYLVEIYLFIFYLTLVLLITISSSYSYNKKHPQILVEDTNYSSEELTYEDEVAMNSSVVDFYSSYNTANIWVGNMAKEKFSSVRSMHVTYTLNFGYKVVDPERKVTKVEITNISPSTNLAKGDLKILPYRHVAQEDSSLQSNRYLDWQTHGYTYATDYSKMPSLGESYFPEVCNKEYSCDFLDEVGYKNGSMSLRFKYVNVAEADGADINAGIDQRLKEFNVLKTSLYGNFKWKVTLYLDDGSSYSRDYNVTLDPSELDWTGSSTNSIKF